MNETADKPTSLPEKNKGGRPVLRVKRSTSINVRLTRAERFLIETKARKAKLSPSDWFRKAAQNATVRPRLTAEDMHVLQVLAGMANNLNQLTRLAHTYGLASFQQDCRELLARINEVFNRFKGE